MKRQKSKVQTQAKSGAPFHAHASTISHWLRVFVALQHQFEHAFDRFRERYRALLGLILTHRLAFGGGFLAFCVASLLLIPFLGQDFFPSVDAGIFRLHVRAHTGTRIEETAVLVDHVENAIRREIPAKEIQGIIDNIGLPISGINLSYNDSGTAGPADADIMVSLKTGASADTRLCPESAPRAQSRFSRHDVLLPSRRHRQRDD